MSYALLEDHTVDIFTFRIIFILNQLDLHVVSNIDGVFESKRARLDCSYGFVHKRGQQRRPLGSINLKFFQCSLSYVIKILDKILLHLIILIIQIIFTHLIFFDCIQVFPKVRRTLCSHLVGLFYDLAHGFVIEGLLLALLLFLNGFEHRLDLGLLFDQELTRGFCTLVLSNISQCLFKLYLIVDVLRLLHFLFFLKILLVGLIVFFLRQLLPLHLTAVAVLISLSKITVDFLLLLLHVLFVL